MEPSYLLKLELENVRCFGERATLDLRNKSGKWANWTILLGDNGTGKTGLLQILAGLESKEIKTVSEGNSYTHFQFMLIDKIFSGLTIPSKNAAGRVSINAYLSFNEDPYFITFLRDGLTTRNLPSQMIIYGYGANRLGSEKLQSPPSVFSSNSETIFNNKGELLNVEDWLRQLDYSASKESAIQNFVQDKFQQVKTMLINLLPDVQDIRMTEPTRELLTPKVEFKTSFGWMFLSELSLGYQSMISWMVDLAARMFDRYGASENPLEEPAIVLVDEIDLHLHPKWQRNIFDYLSSKFPKTQFIVTAHSPLVVQAAPEDANIVLLQKVDNYVQIDNDQTNVQNWRLDQILASDLYGISSSRGLATEQLLQERNNLLQKAALTENESQRLKELNEMVDELPTADNSLDIEAMEIIRKVAERFKKED